MYYQTKKEVCNYEKPRTALPDLVCRRMISELWNKNNEFGIERKDCASFQLMIDVGCGNGRHSKFFVPYFQQIIGIDYSEMQIERANELNEFKNVEYVCGRAEALPIADESVDFATFIYSAFLVDIKKVEIELVRVLKPSGVAVIYGDLIEQLELLNEKGNSSRFSESCKSPMDLWKECMEPFVQFATQTNHPERKLFDRNETIHEELTLLRKRKVSDTQFRVERNLDNLIEYFCSVPFYGDFANSQKINPFEDFSKKLKDLWGIPHEDNSDVNISVTHRCFMLFLDKDSE